MIEPNFKALTADRLVGHVDPTLSEHILDVAVAQTEAKIDCRIMRPEAVAAV
jgi:hypothetical protein